ncbi:MAG: pyridoxal-phosphate dependent enzyme [Acidobacteria bacterium]|nr:pyridoxal-phosphate dependent enzyme [Acidobacteriota bacterium]
MFELRVRGLRVLLKLESLQVTGTFKVRGALAAVTEIEGDAVVACSGGNHGLGIAYAAKAAGKRAVVFVPSGAAEVKVRAMRNLGAEVRQPCDSMDGAFAEAETYAARSRHPLIHPYDDPAVVMGQGTLGLDLRKQAPEVTRWLVGVGGGGLAAGLSLALDGRAEVVPVEPEACPSLTEAQRVGVPAKVACSGSARTSLGAPSIGRTPWGILQGRVGPCLRVPESQILGAQRWLWEEARLVAEPGGVTALAALLSGVFEPMHGETVGVVLCGGNADGIVL